MIAMVKNSENLENLRRVASLSEWSYVVNEKGTACISLNGPTQYALDGWYLTNASYINLRGVLEECMNNDAVKNIVISISSPGGEAMGLVETAEYIHTLSEKKPVYAYTDSLACSAAYLIGASCKAFYSSRYAEVGCCGVMARIYDYSEYEKKMGFFSKIFRSKNAQKKNLSPLTEEGEKELQTKIDELEDGYFSALSSFGRDIDSIKTLEGGTCFGEQAKELGFIDDVKTYEEFMSLIEGDSEEMNVEEMTTEQRTELFNTLCSLEPSLVENRINAERERISSLNALRKPYNAELIDKAISDGQSKEDITNELVALSDAETERLKAENSAMKPIIDSSEATQDVKTPVAEEVDRYLAAAEKLNKEN